MYEPILGMDIGPQTQDNFIIKMKSPKDGMWASCPLSPRELWALLLIAHIFVTLVFI